MTRASHTDDEVVRMARGPVIAQYNNRRLCEPKAALRHSFLTLVLVLLLAPLAAEAQAPRNVPRVGVLAPAGVTAFDVDAFRRGLRDLASISTPRAATNV